MSDNTILNPGSGGDTMRTIDRSGTGPNTQVVSVDIGAAGAGNETILRKGQTTMAESLPVAIASNQSTLPLNVAQMNGVATTMGNGASGTGVQRVTLASDSTGNIATIGTSVTPGTAATNLGKARDAAAGGTDTGVASLMVRRDSPTALTPAAGDYEVPQINAAGAQYVHPTFAGSAGATPAQVVSAATTNATSVKASAGVLTSVVAANTSATAWAYVKLHNTSSAPTAGSGVVYTVPLPPLGGATVEFPTGVGFSTGIGLTITGGITTADTTAVAANQVVVALTYH